MQAKKVSPQVFKLASVAGRVGLLAGITAGTVSREEVEAAVLKDTEKRPYRKPVVADYTRYPSITAAAEDICGWKASRREVLAMQKNIANWCNSDDVPGCYWAE